MKKLLDVPTDDGATPLDLTTTTSRRHFLKCLVSAAPAAALISGCESRSVSSHSGRVFFSTEEETFIDAATARLIPTDNLGVGANEAGVTQFIDIQLAGAYGRAERWYMRGPWPEGSEQQGFQSRYTPAQIYRDAMEDINVHCHSTYKKSFAELSGDTQDEILHAMEKGTLELQKVSSKTFFTLLWQNTQEGFLADPAYGGNRDFAGWKLIGFPGPRYNYLEDIGKFGQPYKQPFVSLVGRNPKAHTEGEL